MSAPGAYVCSFWGAPKPPQDRPTFPHPCYAHSQGPDWLPWLPYALHCPDTFLRLPQGVGSPAANPTDDPIDVPTAIKMCLVPPPACPLAVLGGPYPPWLGLLLRHSTAGSGFLFRIMQRPPQREQTAPLKKPAKHSIAAATDACLTSRRAAQSSHLEGG